LEERGGRGVLFFSFLIISKYLSEIIDPKKKIKIKIPPTTPKGNRQRKKSKNVDKKVS